MESVSFTIPVIINIISRMVLFIVLIVSCDSMGQSDRRTNKRLSKQVGVFFDVEYEESFACVRDFRFLVFMGAAVQIRQVMVHYKRARVGFPLSFTRHNHSLTSTMAWTQSTPNKPCSSGDVPMRYSCIYCIHYPLLLRASKQWF
jgi:hypothetical protein